MKLRDQMPELTGATAWLNGQYKKADLIGKKPTLIHFWSVSCSQCKDSMPDMNTFLHRYKGKFNVIAVHMPISNDDLDLWEVKNAAARYGITQPICVDSELKVSDSFGTQYVPAYYVFDKDGKLRHYQSGGGGMRLLFQRLKRLLTEMNYRR
ncbi:TlpA disulfide reductase family protein [Sporosarcina sp. UB5]|uniref:TlpA disulfide reductase family protein n=1 Tax=Sporosarcina sp. UB5 TaxID=3047463 RepID=UPI003D78CF7A